MNTIKIQPVQKILDNRKLCIPNYQRPYKWTKRNVEELLSDIDIAIKTFENNPETKYKYRIGTVLVHNNKKKKTLDIIDGQQRIVTLFLLRRYLLPKNKSFVRMNLDDNNTKFHICENFGAIKDWFSMKSTAEKNAIKKSFSNLLEFVVITVERQEEAFQLFDSQNSRGKALYPHDLLKAYHLREMDGDKFEMQRVVENWEEMDRRVKHGKKKGTNKIEDLFDDYLFPIYNWSEIRKTWTFSANDIDTYKGIRQNCTYPYAKRAEKSMPIFQITEPFIAGKDFFQMVHYYLPLLEFLKNSVNETFPELNRIMDERDDYGAGFGHCQLLFYCALLCYYDRFKNLDEKAVRKLFTWAFMLRVDRHSLSYLSINKYAVGECDDTTNKIAMFHEIIHARSHTQIAMIPVSVSRDSKNEVKDNWKPLYSDIKNLNGIND